MQRISAHTVPDLLELKQLVSETIFFRENWAGRHVEANRLFKPSSGMSSYLWLLEDLRPVKYISACFTWVGWISTECVGSSDITYHVWRKEEILCFHWIFFPFPLVYLIHISDMMTCIVTVYVEWITLNLKSVFKLWGSGLYPSAAGLILCSLPGITGFLWLSSPSRSLDTHIFFLLHNKSPAV